MCLDVKVRTIVLGLCLGALLPPGVAAAQEADGTVRVWVAAGLGGGVLPDAGPAAFMGQLVVQRGPHHLALRGVHLEEVGSSGSASASDVGVVYGRVRRGWLGHALVAAGVSAASCDDRFRPEACDGSTTVGLPFLAEAAVRLGSVVGVGLQAFGNLNPHQSFGGATLFLQLGWNPSR